MYYSITFFGPTTVTVPESIWLNDPDYPAGSIREVNANTWDDWHLIPSSRPTIAHPAIETNYQDVLGKDGIQDVTEYVPGEVVWGDRTGTLEFLVANDYEDWKKIREKIIYNIHGKSLKMKLEEQPEYYYEGFFQFNDWRSEAQFSKVAIDYTLQPYKKLVSDDSIVTDDL